MAFKIKNVTNLLEKRHPFINTSVDIAYNKKNLLKENIRLRVGEELIFDSDELPVSIHNLKIKKFIRVTKISEHDKHGLMNPKEDKPAIAQEKQEVETKTNKDKKKSVPKQDF